jgi:hypothetical protein
MITLPLEIVRAEGGRFFEGPDDFGRIWASTPDLSSASELPGGAPEPTPSELDSASVRLAGSDAGLQTVKGEEGLQTVKVEEGGPSKANLAARGQRQPQRHALSFMEYQEEGSPSG